MPLRPSKLPLAPFALAFTLVSAVTLGAFAAPKSKVSKVPEVQVSHAHIVVGDVLPNASADVAAIDLGPAPQLGGTRVIDNDEIAFAFKSHELPVPESLPPMTRVTRRSQTIDAREMERMVREGLDAKLGRGVSLTTIRLTKPIQIPAGYSRYTADIPRPARKAGPVTSATTLTFFEGDQSIAMVSVVVDLLLNEEATIPDAARGAHVTLVMRKGLVEVTTQASASIDGDIGGVIPVLLRPSGRTIRARIEDRDHAIALDDS